VEYYQHDLALVHARGFGAAELPLGMRAVTGVGS
jgi:hypothetical protein